MEFKAKDIAALLKGVVEGDGEVMVNNVSKIEEGKPNTLAFLATPKYEHFDYVDFASQRRIVKDSAFWYQKIIETNGRMLTMNQTTKEILFLSKMSLTR